MPNSQNHNNRCKNRGKKGKGAGGGAPPGEKLQRNGFDNARVISPNPFDSQKLMYEREASELIRRFIRSGESSETVMNANRDQRRAIHEVAKIQGLNTKSHGNEPNRCLVITLRNKKFNKGSFIVTDPIVPKPDVLSKVNSFVAEYPITQREKEEFLMEQQNKLYTSKSGSLRNRSDVPRKASCPEKLKAAREKLPASKHKQNVLDAIENSEVVIISGGTGCGKTTQVPQFILEDAHDQNKKVRVMVTQPRRIAAISISERVAKERGEPLGEVVGYQVRLESKQSDKTLLTYCTTGVLLRMLTADPIASGITHIIMDEIHEREINTDYLLIALRECLQRRSDLKVILMSATIEGNMNLFAEYFDKLKVSVIRIESLTYDVKTFYLDQILAMSGYEPPHNQGFLAPISFEAEDWQEELAEIRQEQQTAPEIPLEQKFEMSMVSGVPIISLNAEVRLSQPLTLDTATSTFCNQTQTYYSSNGACYNNNTVIDANGEWVSGDYITEDGDVIRERHMNHFMTATGAAELGSRPMVIMFPPNSPKSLYVDGVRYTPEPHQHPSALQQQMMDRASMPDCLVQVHCNVPVKPQLQITDSVATSLHRPPLTSATPASPSSTKSGLGRLGPSNGGFGFGEKHTCSLMLEKKFREEMKTVIPDRPIYYHPNVNELVDKTDFTKLRFAEKYEMFYGVDFKNSLDLNLVDHVVKYLADSPVFGSILVFLPGYDDIQEMMMRISRWSNKLINIENVVVIPLHSQMNSNDHGEIFRPVNQGTRKIILATNIAEASITIEDVIFVVDTGKAKEKAYNHEAKLSTLTVCPIARSNAKQRSGRAGRVTNGYCIRLYSEKTFEEMPETQVAEMKRSAIYDVTLHAKLFAPRSMKIAEFLSLAPEPPALQSIEQSMEFLEQIGAFYYPDKFKTSEEDVDEEGKVKEEVETEVKDPELTDMGRLMSRLPLDPQLSRMLLFGLALKCLAPIVNLIAMMANRDPFILPSSESREDQTRMKNAVAQCDFSDHLMLIRLCSLYVTKSNNASFQFCKEHFLSHNTMRMVSGTRRQIIQELVRAKLIYVPQDRDLMSVLNDRFFNKHSNSWPMVQAAIAAGCYPSIGVSGADSKLKKVQTFHERTAGLHPSSILKKQAMRLNKNSSNTDPRIEFLAFQELAQMPSDKSLSMKMVTAIPSITALLFTGSIRLSEQAIGDYQIVSDKGDNTPLDVPKSQFGDNYELFELDDWYGVRADKQTLRQFLRIRHKLMHFFLRGIHDPGMFGQDTQRPEKRLLDTVRDLLESEHKRYRYTEVKMPNFFVRDYDVHQNPNKNRRQNLNNGAGRQKNDVQPTKHSKNREAGEPSNNTSVASRFQSKSEKEQKPKYQQSNWNQPAMSSPPPLISPVPNFDACIPPPNFPSQMVYGTTSHQNGNSNWTPSPPTAPMPPNPVQGSWPAHMQVQPQHHVGHNEDYVKMVPRSVMGGCLARGKGRAGPKTQFNGRNVPQSSQQTNGRNPPGN